MMEIPMKSGIIWMMRRMTYRPMPGDSVNGFAGSLTLRGETKSMLVWGRKTPALPAPAPSFFSQPRFLLAHTPIL